MKKVKRNNCVITGSENFESLYIFKNFPVFMGCTEKSKEYDIKSDMEWIFFKESGMIQLKEPLPLEVVYSEFHNSGCVGSLWELHHFEFAKFISKSNPETVLEIGGGHGILSLNYDKIGKTNWTIIEPNPTPLENVNANFIKGFFDKDFKTDISFDAVVHSHVFEHLYDPKTFIEDISNILEEGKHLIFSIPNMNEMLKRKYTNFLNFEHTYFLSEEFVTYFLTNNNFEIVEKKYFKEDHSIFFRAKKNSKIKKTPLGQEALKNKSLFFEYIKHHLELVKQLNETINKLNSEVYLFGAHVFSQYLISFGLEESKISFILDNDPVKQGKRLYGTNLKVKSPKVLSKEKRPIVILRAGVYNDEIKKDILENINSKCEFI